MTPDELKALTTLLMCSNPYPCEGERILKDLATREAQWQSYDNWIEAYHRLE